VVFMISFIDFKMDPNIIFKKSEYESFKKFKF
jgi:hypothetical protein